MKNQPSVTEKKPLEKWLIFFCIFNTEHINYGNHVGNERYLLFAQETRIRFLQSIGCTEAKFGEFGLVLTEAHVEYFHELFHGDAITIKLSVSAPSRASFDCFYEIIAMRPTGMVTAAMIKTAMVCFDYSERKVRSIPEHLKQLLLQCSMGSMA
jgi:acyl-CoA thioester hydrolase